MILDKLGIILGQRVLGPELCVIGRPTHPTLRCFGAHLQNLEDRQLEAGGPVDGGTDRSAWRIHDIQAYSAMDPLNPGCPNYSICHGGY